MFKPELINTMKGYKGKDFVNDLIAGVIVGIVALPLAIAFAIASGVSPERGLFTAIVAGFCISALGGTRVQIGGPTGAFTVIVFGIVAQYGYNGLVIATLMAGVLLILLGVFKMGGLVKFIPYTIVTGFTAGIAVTIATGQIGDFFGLTATNVPANFTGKLAAFWAARGTINVYSFLVALISLIVIFVWPKINKKIPGSLVVIVFATVITVILEKTNGLTLATIGSRYGSIPSSLPKPAFPQLSLDTVVQLFPSAVSIAVLGAIESLLSAVVADGMIGAKHDSNTELIAEGIANIASPLFGGIPATGAIARTATNVKNGGRTPVAGIIHAVTLLLIMLVLGRYVVYIPMAALAAVLMNVAWNMAGFPAVKALLKGQKSDITVLAVTFLITVFIDLTVAIEVGLGFAAFFFIKKMIDVSEVQTNSKSIVGGISGNGDVETIELPKDVLVYEIDGPLFFGTVRKFELAVEQAGVSYKALILRMRNTLYLDAGGLRALEQLKAACDRKGVTIIISGIHTQPYLLMQKTGTLEVLGKENVFDNITAALKRAQEVSAK
ncbi:MAG: SulP family inorganic anion transporter [Treponemataceae bacterium]|nr:SulP family inorganic anion transporter [Treponemataceae bacterium]